MAKQVVVDPITRIEGHLRIELETEGGTITKAWSETTQFRGIEEIVTGRDPRDVWAFVQRICGVCTSVHAIASISAVENAIGSNPPKQAKAIRDLVITAQEVQDHVIHFYHLHALDWVDVTSALAADPVKTLAFAESIAKSAGVKSWKGNTVERFAEVKATVKSIVDSGQLSIFTGGYWGHPAYKLPPEANLMAVAHYLDALEFQRSMIRIVTVFGGKNPHPNFLVGGMACSIDQDKSESINQVQLDQIAVWIAEADEFVHKVYLPDALAIVGVYKEYFDIGASVPNFFAVGMSGATYAGDPRTGERTSPHTDVKPGVIMDFDLANVQEFDPSKITEGISSAWYEYANGATDLHPSVGETTVKYTGPKLPYKWLANGEEYTWSKAPRYDGKVMQVGPIARVLLAYAQGHERTKALVDLAIAKIGLKPAQLNSTAGRALARCVEAVTSVETLGTIFNTFVDGLKKNEIDVFDSSKWDPSTWPKEASGYSFVEVARGNLSHWVQIKDGKVTHYQAVVPTTWLAGGRDKDGHQGPYEESLAGNGKHPLSNPDQPIEVLRTIHSFDPCMSCAVHLLDTDGQEMQVVVS
jgi:hydrogenase large subunit